MFDSIIESDLQTRPNGFEIVKYISLFFNGFFVLNRSFCSLLLQVQNADDNIYPENVEPTLTFILQDSGIVVLNNERGFFAQNIRALCDIGNSTKKGSNAGYIGQKGIGFKSVFRVCYKTLTLSFLFMHKTSQ